MAELARRRSKMNECIGYNKNDKPIYVEIEEEVHPMFMGVIDEEEVWTKAS